LLPKFNLTPKDAGLFGLTQLPNTQKTKSSVSTLYSRPKFFVVTFWVSYVGNWVPKLTSASQRQSRGASHGGLLHRRRHVAQVCQRPVAIGAAQGARGRRMPSTHGASLSLPSLLRCAARLPGRGRRRRREEDEQRGCSESAPISLLTLPHISMRSNSPATRRRRRPVL
jgi:hypothetical protein